MVSCGLTLHVRFFYWDLSLFPAKETWLGFHPSCLLAAEGTGTSRFKQAADLIWNPFAQNAKPWLFSRGLRCVDFCIQNNKHNCACLSRKNWGCSCVTHSQHSSHNTFTLPALPTSSLGDFFFGGGGICFKEKKNQSSCLDQQPRFQIVLITEIAKNQGAPQSLPLNCAIPLARQCPVLCATVSLGKILHAWNHHSLIRKSSNSKASRDIKFS